MATADKYDRQLRLWGAAGQRLLAEAHVLLLKAGPTGTETMKNLVLPGIGQFTVVDDGLVAEADVANNFFLPAAQKGRPRSQVACEALAELNPDVRGHFEVQAPLEFVKTSDLAQYSLILCTEMSEQEIVQVEAAAWAAKVPLIVARTVGFVGLCRVSAAAHCVIESKPSPAPVEDLRLADPFPALEALVSEVDLDALDGKDFKHVPFTIVLIKLAEKWRAEHQGSLPETTQEKREFRDAVKSIARKPWGEEENLGEAFNNAFLAYTVRQVPPEVQEIFEDPACSGAGAPAAVTDFNGKFWLMARALRDFVKSPEEGNGKLPVSGQVPDMTASTEIFVRMQQVYKAKASEDAAAVHERVKVLLAEAGAPADLVSSEDVDLLCKNASHLRACCLSRISDEADPTKLNKDEIVMAVMEGVGDASPQSPILFYFMVRAADAFLAKHGRQPGANGKLELDPAEADADTAELFAIATELVDKLELGTQLNLSQAHAREFVRYGGVELHNIAAVLGGIASQESVKLITHQYALLNNTYVYNGITCTGAVFAL